MLQQSFTLRSLIVLFMGIGIHAFGTRSIRRTSCLRTTNPILQPLQQQHETTIRGGGVEFRRTAAFATTSKIIKQIPPLHSSSSSTLFSTTDAQESTTTAAAVTADAVAVADPSTMRIKEIKNELTSLNVMFTDCFDKESLVERLLDARNDTVSEQFKTKPPKEEPSSEPAASTTNTSESPPSSTFDKEEFMTNLRSLKVRELRTKCAQANIRWAHMIEKEELVKALLAHEETIGSFSGSGKLIPSQVVDIDESTLEQELKGGLSTPLLLDVYATWCGPCKMMVPHLEQAAEELKSTVRVAKMDSDQNQAWSSKLQVNALPTVILFDGQTGKEIKRVEGALMKDALVELGQSGL